jgi:ABC-2 type transport system permease protein
MNISLRVIMGFFKKEFAQVLRDPVMRIFLLVVPVIQLTLFGYAISNEFGNLKLAIDFTPGDVMARQLSERLYASGWFVRPGLERKTAEDYLRSGVADAVAIMPGGGLTKAMGRDGGQLQLLIDATNTTKARAIENYFRLITQRFAKDKLPQAKLPNQIVFDTRFLYNPTMETSYFMVPGIIVMIMCITTVMLSSMSLAREKELGTFETIIAAPVRPIEIILGKSIPFIVMGIVNALLVTAGGFLIFGVPLRGSLLLLILAAFVFVSTAVGVGIFISTIAKNQQQAMMGSFLFIFPAVLLSGIMFPIENMPPLIRGLAYLNPLTYFVQIIRNVMLKGASPELVWTNIALTLVFFTAVTALAANRFRQTLN